ncbi:MAG: 2'-5' RNA ligase family protein, partial [Methanomicrobiales archaeon]|nr:2'-5' RNA ligase family protein [Methanomicrobiales archaeon]
MDDTYLVEIRLARTKWRVKNQVSAIAGHYHLEDHMERHPHVTIYGPLTLKPGIAEDRLITLLGEIAGRHDPLPFLIGPLEKREGMHGSVIAYSVQPSGALVALVRTVAHALLPITESMNAWDTQPEKKWFHVTVANRLSKEIATRAYDDLTNNVSRAVVTRHTGIIACITTWIHSVLHNPGPGPGLLDDTGLRLTVMKGQDILAEYDFLQKTWIRSDHDHK